MPPGHSERGTLPTPDSLIIRTLWRVLLAAVISLFPFTIYSTFLVPIAEAAEQEASVVGALRGLGGVAALIVGIALAPFIARWSAPHTTSAALVLLSAASLIATLGTLPALVLFCIGIGVATAVLTPTLLTIATTTFTRDGDSGRAATIVTATQSLAAVLAAPVIGGIGLWNGWHGALWVTAGTAAIIAILILRAESGSGGGSTPLRYAEAFHRLRHRRDLLALIGIAFLRTTAFMGYLAFLAVYYHDRFALNPVSFTLIWTLSGASFFTGNYLAGRWARGTAPRRRRLLYVGLLCAAVAVIIVFTTEWLPFALIATAVMGFSHAIVAALVTTQIAERGEELTPSAYSINAAGMSLGVFTGALVASIGLNLGGGVGVAISLVVPTLVAIALVPNTTRTQSVGDRKCW
ncbi:MFS transporter [Rhodococcus artemisiae]|uniref:MFS transporter n=1 Tax=Rhodococcus artemisiae TaxID=714159 RepID=A0ABU7LAE8_9NOCA|nr:MFS transporter [Rhodococcus artemisiae]MEE2058520.1 MFS transporter [Rhodococcus artemisiae]